MNYYPSTIPKFGQYLMPASVAEAVELLSQHGREAKVLAGGTDLVVMMRSHAVLPQCLIDISRIPGLDRLEQDVRGNLKIGALTTLRAVEESALIKQHYPLLAAAVHRMGATQLRQIATVVGNVCRSSPSADSVCALLALGAAVEITGSAQTRTVQLADFFTGPGQNALEAGELVTGLTVPPLPAGTGTAFLKLARTGEDLAKVNAAAVLTVQNGVCTAARLALGGVAPTPIRALKAEALINGHQLSDTVIAAVAEMAASEAKPISDLRSTAEYRREMCQVLMQRAIQAALKEIEQQS